MKEFGINKPPVSLVTAIRNRTSVLSATIDSWLNNARIHEVIIVDWGSDISSLDFVKSKKSNKIKHLYVDDQKYYSHTQSNNLGALHSTYDQLIFLDSDILLHDNFFDAHKLVPGIFYAGNWEIARDENETHLNGQFYISKEDFFRVNGYDERFESYGYDDTDLYNRLTKSSLSFIGRFYIPKFVKGIKRLNIHPDYLTHLAHSDDKRVESFPVNNLSARESIQRNNKLTLTRKAWDKSFKLKEYIITQTDVNSYNVKQIKQNFFAVKPLNGLGNRLRVIASSWAVSEALGKKLYVCWNASPGFSEEEFKSLFSTDFDFISEETYRNLEARQDVVVLNNRVQMDEKYTTLESGHYQDYNFWTSEIDNSNLLYEWSNSLDHFSRLQIKKHPSLINFDQLFEDKLRRLTPASDIASKVIDFCNQQFSANKVLGVHIRRGDAINSPWAEEYKVSTDDGFAMLMEKEIQKDPKIKFFLSTDCPNTLEKFKNLYPDRLIHYKKDFVESKLGESKQNQAEAFVEMLLLAKTSKIFGSRWSTFSEMASRIGGVELEICC